MFSRAFKGSGVNLWDSPCLLKPLYKGFTQSAIIVNSEIQKVFATCKDSDI